MPRGSRIPLEEKLAWMRERQREREKEEERRRQEEEVKAKMIAERALELREPNGAPQQPPTVSRRKMMRVDEVAKLLGVSTTTVLRWFRHRAVIVHPGPRKTTMLISEQILDDWITEHTAKQPAPRGRVPVAARSL